MMNNVKKRFKNVYVGKRSAVERLASDRDKYKKRALFYRKLIHVLVLTDAVVLTVIKHQSNKQNK